MTHICLISPHNDMIKYFKCLFNNLDISGSHNSVIELRGELGFLMKQLKESNHNDPIVDKLLHNIYNTLQLKYSYEEFYQEYLLYLRLLSDRAELIDNSRGCLWNKLGDIPNLEKKRWNMWGSYKQFLFGKCVVDVLNCEYGYKLHPIWGCLLSPTGGIIGYGNNELIERRWDSYMSLHSCVHDAGGYLYNYHKIGNGYNYLNTWMTLFPRYSPFSCQIAGLRFWKKFMENN